MGAFIKAMASPAGRMFVGVVAFVYATAALGVSYPRAQVQNQSQPTALPADYRVGPNDRIFLSVPQRPDLNRELVVSEKGDVTIPLVGEVAVRGLTAAEIEARLLQSLREYYPSVNRVQVTLSRASSNVIFVSGDVKAPGKYSFTEPVNVWEAIREAGGPMPTASLVSVRVIQDRARGGASMMIDVQSALDGGTMASLPILRPGDTILVPTREEGYTGTAGVSVMGAVLTPGLYPLQGRQDLISAVLLAGGPTERAKLDGVRIVRPRPDGTAETIKVSLDRYINKGDVTQNPPLRSGDTVNIERKGFTTQEVGLVLGFITAIGTLVLLYYTIQDEIEQN